jgi:5-formyltetrahydrofolate cyclo-ligase
MTEKQFLRKNLLTKILSLTQEEIKRRSTHVAKTLSELSLYKEAKVIMAYYPLKGEVDLREMIRKDSHKRFCFPVMDISRKELVPFGVERLDEDFCKGPYGVMQPAQGKSKKFDVKDIDLIIVPGLAFDRARNRLGRGGGFYDRFLHRIHPPTRSFGVAFDFQILETLPTYPSLDQKVDCIVTEHEVM